LLKPISDRIRLMPEVIERARLGSFKLAQKNGWSLDFCYRRALEKISGGMAILESYYDFVRSNPSPDSLFYRYAIGDVIAEYQLYQKMRA
jgi:hypothetical protein